MQGQTKGKVFSLVAMFAGSAVIVVFVVLSKGQLPLRERSADHVFPPATGVLAQLELNGDVKDSSGNGRDARLMGGTFVPTRWGQASRECRAPRRRSPRCSDIWSRRLPRSGGSEWVLVWYPANTTSMPQSTERLPRLTAARVIFSPIMVILWSRKRFSFSQ